jgi:hypothetical protein
MGFGSPFAHKSKKVEPPRPVAGALLRIVLLAACATICAAYGIYLYYTHAFRPKPHPQAVDSGQIEIEVQ